MTDSARTEEIRARVASIINRDGPTLLTPDPELGSFVVQVYYPTDR